MRAAIGIEGVEGEEVEGGVEGNEGAACAEDAEDAEDADDTEGETNVAAPTFRRPWRDTGNTSAGDIGMRAVVVVPSGTAATSG